MQKRTDESTVTVPVPLHAELRTGERAGIEGLRFHDLRHEYGSRLGDADVNLKKIARLMGHSNTKQTERYVHPTDDGLLQATTIAERPGSSRIVPRRLREVC
jgi:integrase